MAPSEAPLNAEAIARALTGLPAALFIGDVSGPLNAEAGALAEELDPKLEEIKVSARASSSPIEACCCNRILRFFPWTRYTKDYLRIATHEITPVCIICMCTRWLCTNMQARTRPSVYLSMLP